jgi:2-iminobutanoate/2-iminopropanoate deaminase
MQAPHFSPWKEAAPLIFISGQLAFDSNGQISVHDIAGQTQQALRNLETVLKSAALELRDVVKTTVWLRDAADFPAFNEAYAKFFGETKPARSTVVCALVHPKALVEIEATAGKILT